MSKTGSVMVLTDIFPPVAAVGVYRTAALLAGVSSSAAGP